MANRIRIVLIDDHAIFRQGVQLILHETTDMVVVGEATTGEEGVALFAALGDAVDVVITDLVLPGINGLDVLRQIKAQRPEVHVLLLTMYTDDEHIQGMIEAGVDGYILKQVAVEELIAAVRTVQRGETAISPLIAKRIMQQLSRGRVHERPVDTLTARERQILRLLADGATSKEIAQQLELSSNTIDNHRARILNKLGVHNTAAAIRLASRQGIIPTVED